MEPFIGDLNLVVLLSLLLPELLALGANVRREGDHEVVVERAHHRDQEVSVHLLGRSPLLRHVALQPRVLLDDGPQLGDRALRSLREVDVPGHLSGEELLPAGEDVLHEGQVAGVSLRQEHILRRERRYGKKREETYAVSRQDCVKFSLGTEVPRDGRQLVGPRRLGLHVVMLMIHVSFKNLNYKFEFRCAF